MFGLVLGIDSGGPFGGTGVVVSSPVGIVCPADGLLECSALFEEGTVVTVTATADPGSVFGFWFTICTGTDPCVFTMDGNKLLGGTFFIDGD
mgnify:CR=1 FL=1